jgi:hypothetical protein
LDSIPVDKITKWEAEFREHLTSTQVKLLETTATGNIIPEVEANIKKGAADARGAANMYSPPRETPSIKDKLTERNLLQVKLVNYHAVEWVGISHSAPVIKDLGFWNPHIPPTPSGSLLLDWA